MNIVGEGVPNFVLNQILVRQKVYGSGYLKSRTPSELVYLNTNTAWCKLISGTNVNNSSELARKFILFNGTTPNGIGINTANGAYTVAQDEFGFRPMPGIISANINHENRGSLKRAEVKIKCYNIEQFRILDLLYLRLGYNILLEWGHSMYYTEDFNNEKKLIKSLNGAGISLSEDFLKEGIDYDEFLFKIFAQRRNTQGNYDALFARVENFSWSFNKDGSYDITLKLISIGDVIESLKVNVSLPTSILAPTNPSEAQTSADIIRNYSSMNSIGAWLQQGIPSIDLQALIDEAKKLQDPTYLQTSLPPATTQGTTINSPQSNFNIPIVNGLDNSTGNGFKLTFDLIDPSTGKPIDPNTNKPYEDPLQSPNSQLTNPTFIQISFKSDLGTQYYVKLGDFLSFLQNGDSNQSSIIPKIFVKGKNKGVPQVKFNLIENQNLIYVDPAQISVDPTVCFVKRNITINNTTYLYSDDYDKAIDFTIEIDGTTYGKILDVYINSAFIITTIQNNTNTLGKLDLYTFLDKLIKATNSALGGFNELELIIDETTNEIKIIDKNPLPNKDKLLKNLNRSTTPAEFLLYGYTDTQASFVKDFNFKTEIPPSLATTLVVASQNKGIVVGIDGTGFSNLNKNLTDRFKEKITNDISIADELKNTIDRITSVNERWGEYKNFLISLSTDSSLGYTTDNCATKSNCSTYRTTLKDLIKINASFKDIKLPPPNPTVTKRTPVYDQDGNLEGYALSDSKGIEDNERLIKTTNDLENLKNTLGRNNIGNPSPTSGFLPFNLSLSINGLSGMKMYQAFVIDTRYLPANYPSNVEFLIKNIKHQISDQQWTTQLESFAITKNASSNQAQSQNYLNDSEASSNYFPGRITISIDPRKNNEEIINNNNKTIVIPDTNTTSSSGIYLNTWTKEIETPTLDRPAGNWIVDGVDVWEAVGGAKGTGDRTHNWSGYLDKSPKQPRNGVGKTLDVNIYKKWKNNPQVYWAVWDLDNGKPIAQSANANENVYGASVSKAIVAAHYFDKFSNNGVLPNNKDYWYVVTSLIPSNNNSWKILQDKIDPNRSLTNSWSKSKGYNNMEPAIRPNLINAVGMNKFWDDISKNKLKGSGVIAKSCLAGSTHLNRSQLYIPSEYYVGTKTGTMDNQCHDSGFVGKIGDKWFAITVLTQQSAAKSSVVAAVWGGLFREYYLNDINFQIK